MLNSIENSKENQNKRDIFQNEINHYKFLIVGLVGDGSIRVYPFLLKTKPNGHFLL